MSECLASQVQLSARAQADSAAGETAANASLSWMPIFIERPLPSLAPSRQPAPHADGSPAPAYRVQRYGSRGQFLAHLIAIRPQARAHFIVADCIQYVP